MEYQQDVKETQDIIRQVLPLLNRLEIPVNPINYALWYEYQLGRCKPLNNELEKVLSGEQAFEEGYAKQLFLTHIATSEMERLEKVEFEIGRLLNDIEQIVIDAGLDLEKYTIVLEGGGTRLHNADDIREIRKAVRTLIDDTRAVSESNRKTGGFLKDKATEMDELRAELDRVRQESVRDPLTGLANRRAFDRNLIEALEQRQNALKSVCLIMLDIDHFKTINDEHGHQIGDRILRYVGSVLKKNVKGMDLVARYGGDEFVIILENAPVAGVKSIAEAIRKQVSESRLKRIDTGTLLGDITVSIGFGYARQGDTPENLVERADKALYDAKRKGRNRVSGCGS